MQKTCKRKQLQLDGRSQKTPKSTSEEPYPCHHRPTPEECRAVRDELLALHGFPPEFLKYRRHRLIKMEPFSNEAQSEPLINSDDGDHKEESVLDGLIKIVLSQNTTELNSQKAFASLKSVFPTWEAVACVLMFNLQQDDFPVDTHVFEIARAIGWVPAVADRNKTYLHLNRRIPNELKFDLNCLLYTHGKLCRKCTMKGSSQKKLTSKDCSCPLSVNVVEG